MCAVLKHRFARTSPTLLAIATAAAIAATGCGMFSDDDGSGTANDQNSGEIHEEDHTFRSLHLPAVSTDYPLAVGAKADIEVRGVTDIEDVDVADSDVFSVEDIDGNFVTVRALEAGESSVQVFVDEGNNDLSTDTFELRAKGVASANLKPTCSVLDLAEPMLGIAYDEPKAWPTDEIVVATLLFHTADEEEYVHGYDYHPFDVEPTDGLAFGAPSLLPFPNLDSDVATKSGVELITGPNESDVDIAPTVDGPQVSLPLVYGDTVDEIAIVRLEEDDGADDDAYFSHTLPGEEPTLDRVDNETYTILPHRYADDRIVCEPNLAHHIDEGDHSYRLTSQTPDICKLERLVSSADPSETINLRSSSLVRLNIESAGECTVEVEYLRGPAGEELIEEFSWTVE